MHECFQSMCAYSCAWLVFGMSGSPAGHSLLLKTFSKWSTAALTELAAASFLFCDEDIHLARPFEWEANDLQHEGCSLATEQRVHGDDDDDGEGEASATTGARVLVVLAATTATLERGGGPTFLLKIPTSSFLCCFTMAATLPSLLIPACSSPRCPYSKRSLGGGEVMRVLGVRRA